MRKEFAMIPTMQDEMSVSYHLAALEQRFGPASGASRRSRDRIAAAAARGVRRGRQRMRWDLASVAVGAFFVMAFVTAGTLAAQSYQNISRSLSVTIP